MPQVEIYLTEIEAQMLIYIIIYIKTFYAAAKIKKKTFNLHFPKIKKWINPL